MNEYMNIVYTDICTKCIYIQTILYLLIRIHILKYDTLHDIYVSNQLYIVSQLLPHKAFWAFKSNNNMYGLEYSDGKWIR